MCRAIIAVCFAIVGLVSCAQVDFDDAPVGRFSGSVLLLWVDEGSSTSGDGRFVFVPAPGRPLMFERGGDGGTFPIIQPGMIYTDGGSIPKAAQLFKGFSPWGYAPAYMVHDWLFVARRCLTDGTADANETQIAPVSFQESAEIIAEAIKTLIDQDRVAPNDVAPRVISGTVAGPISKAQWTKQGACAADRVSAEHIREVKDALAQYGTTKSQTPLTKPTASGTRIVAEIAF
ncbi:hypothetical protein [Shimia sp. NS0008-38b]|uniref:hypothetical protein n=1 Tax=Shimia sp. NS0008-38b TaxID=3127653 RepID=UPI00334167D2